MKKKNTAKYKARKVTLYKRSCGFKFGSVTFTEEYQKKEEEKYINIFFFISVLLSSH